jgi:uncharacterized repeat protein (TIGR02543 family)
LWAYRQHPRCDKKVEGSKGVWPTMKHLSATATVRGAARHIMVTATYAVVVLAVTALSVAPAAAQSLPRANVGGSHASGLYAPSGARLPFTGSAKAVCGQPGVGVAQCLTDVLEPRGPTPNLATPTGLSPSTIEDLYGYTSASTAGFGQTIAVVDAFNDPDAARDLDEFSEQYGLPLECKGESSPPSCFEFDQVNQVGGSSLPTTNPSWDLEISLDIEWAHALAPAANILLVEAAYNYTPILLEAEQYAAENAKYVSNSWGSWEFDGESSLDSFLTQPGVSYFAAAGDSGGLVEWPSSSPDVISVGGTSLTFTSGGQLAQEAAWSHGGGGCSSYETASTYQLTGIVNCAGMRATPDLALDADPSSGVSVYDSVPYDGHSGWRRVGGTSAATVMVAAEAAVTGAELNAEYVYESPVNMPFRDITAGSNGHLASTGYDLATGLGSWSYTPGAPTGLSATSISGAVTLNWNAPSRAPASEYTIWRGTASNQETTDIATVSAPTTTYTDTSTTAGSTYYYEVQAANASGVGPFSNEASANDGSGTPYTVTFNANGGTGTMTPETDDVPTALTLNAFTRSGYSFSGWNTAADGSGTAYADEVTYPFTQSATLYAQWTTNTSGAPSGPSSPPTVAAISPSSGPVSGGTPVTITGTGFSTIPGVTAVDFGITTALEVSCSSTTSCTATSPGEVAGTVDVTVGTANGTSTTSVAVGFTYVPIPTVTKITPASGPTKASTKVTIRGSKFVGTVSVHFGGKLATGVRVVSSSEITATAPSGSGTVYVTVSTLGGSSQATTAAKYTFVAPPTITEVTPTIGPTKGGTTVTIWGSNFVGTVLVRFGEKRGTAVRVLSSSEVTVTAPPGSGAVYVTASALGGSSETSATSRYRY